MSLEADIVTRLKAVAGVTALVGSGTSARIYPVRLPQNVTYPAISYFRVSATRESAMGNDVGNVSARFQIDCWGSTYTSARQVCEAVRAALKRYRGSATVTIQDTFLLNEIELFEDDEEGSLDAKLFRVALDFDFKYLES